MKQLVAVLITCLIAGLAAADQSVTLVRTPGGGQTVVGNDLTLDTTEEHNLRFVGNNLEISAQGRVGGDLSAVANSARVLGPVNGDATLVGNAVFINAPIGGDVEVTARRVELGPLADIAGKLRYGAARELVRDAGARVAGPIERFSWSYDIDVEYAVGTMLVIWTLGLLAATALLVAAAPGAAARLRNTLQTRTAASLLMGFAAMVCIPLLAVLLMVTIVGLPFGLLLMLCYPALLLLGYLSCGIALGLMALQQWRATAQQRTGWMVLAACAGVLLLTLIAMIPLLGDLFALIALLAGLGALLLAIRSGQSPAPADPGPGQSPHHSP